MTGDGLTEEALAHDVGLLAQGTRTSVGVAESLTAGRLAAALGAALDASEWFRGGVVAYAPEVKFDVLGVTPGPVNTARCAEEMARGAGRILGADVTVALTGVGGPGPDEGVPAGTVYLATAAAGRCEVTELHLHGEPGDVVVAAAVAAALRSLARTLRDRHADDTPRGDALVR